MKLRVLVIEDEPDMREFLAESLGREEFTVKTIGGGEGIDAVLSEFQPQVVLMDQVLPGDSGTDLIKRLRESPLYSRLAIIMVTGISGEEEKVRALEVGADDYVCKPFHIRELAARIRAVYRRLEQDRAHQRERIQSGDITIDLNAHKVLLQGIPIQLTLTEFRILGELVKQEGSVLSRDHLRQTALGNLNVSDRTIDVHMASLRKKLDHMAGTIETVRGVGYRFCT